MKHIEKLEAAGKIRGHKDPLKDKVIVAAKPKKKAKEMKPTPKALREMMLSLKAAGVEYETEYYFAKPRMFRFDIAIPGHMIAVEYEGIMSGKSRHTSVTGFTRDTTKYNIASALGWKVYRYTVINYKDFWSDLKAIFK